MKKNIVYMKEEIIARINRRIWNYINIRFIESSYNKKHKHHWYGRYNQKDKVSAAIAFLSHINGISKFPNNLSGCIRDGRLGELCRGFAKENKFENLRALLKTEIRNYGMLTKYDGYFSRSRFLINTSNVEVKKIQDVKGILNSVNTCFFNSATQLIHRCVELKKEIYSLVDLGKAEEYFPSYMEILKELDNKKSPSRVRLQIFFEKWNEKYGKDIPIGREQNDPTIFLSNLLEDISKATNTNLSNIKTKVSQCFYHEAKGHYDEAKSEEYSIFSMNVDEQKLVPPPNDDTKPNLDDNPYIYTVSRLLKDYQENIERINKDCNFCNDRNVIFNSKYNILSTGQYLIIAPIIFRMDATTHTGSKINIKFIESLEITINNKTYSLISAVNHIGRNVNSGHYINYSKINNRWYCINDDSVMPVENPDLNGTSIFLYELTY
ncbi:ubiquitin carboxyl-terminal hydrolase [Francisella sp. SYW-9]|uniref:ubiquitin carboxyl-terminal hydrolase n=1 Tax=Francisella sp. SYW-9 TaxID=2610888 RepID=UPI00123CBFB6|nr:ubiquitin carboxyl-terminal hydrolase family protein [Francisella sp. SYW-9]